MDSVSTADASGLNLSWSHTCSGSDRVLLVYVYFSIDLGQTITGITYNGAAMTFLDGQSDGVLNRRMEIWYILNPDSGTNTVAITGAGNPIGADKQAVGISFLGALQSAPTNSKAAGNSTTASVTVTGATGDIFVDGVGVQDVAGGSTITAGAGQTEEAHFTNANTFQIMGCSTFPGEASHALTWTINNTRRWVSIGVRMQPA